MASIDLVAASLVVNVHSSGGPAYPGLRSSSSHGVSLGLYFLGRFSVSP